MALDFSKLPPEMRVPDAPPSYLVWTVVFLVLTLLGIFAVLLLWPASEPTQTPWFWTCVSVFPAGFAALLVSRRYRHYEAIRCDAMEWNKAQKQYIKQAFDRESIPVLVLGCAMRVTDDDETDGLGKIIDGTLTLDARASTHEDNQSISARCLEPEDARFAANDAERHARVLEWLYDRLLADLAGAINALPVELALHVRLEVSGYAGTTDVLALWEQRWSAQKLHAAHPFLATETPGLMALDSWLDDPQGPLDKRALLLVSIGLQAGLDDAPQEGSAEAGIGLLLVSTSISSRHSLRPVAAIHRPVQSQNDRLDHAMTNALRWGSTVVRDLGAAWMTGFNGESVGPLHTALSHAGASMPRDDALQEFNLDRAVGKAGQSAGWLAVACAAQMASQAATPQLVAERSADLTFLSVVATHDQYLNNVSLSA
ncbi:hypothetical protein [Paraburkholderia sp.]|uniref:hypothetical protein n=1 Tax=Paraburkholderia sp. TaxID=1926495 RepID=UPI0025D5EDFF|nr:hypothetical protein [Paraburkholderia sp.]